MLLALDASANAILSFGSIGQDAEWASAEEEDDRKAISAGFVESRHKRRGNTWPQVKSGPAAPKPGEASTYEIDWDLDPGILANVTDRRNPAIAPTAKFPKLLRIAIFHEGLFLPLKRPARG